MGKHIRMQVEATRRWPPRIAASRRSRYADQTDARIQTPIVTIIRKDSVTPSLKSDQHGKRAKRTTVFLIVDDTVQRENLAAELRAVGFDVHDYMTAREFLIDKRITPVVLLWRTTVCRVMNGLELAEQLATERSAFLSSSLSATWIFEGDWRERADVVVKPVAIESLTAAIVRARTVRSSRMRNPSRHSENSQAASWRLQIGC